MAEPYVIDIKYAATVNEDYRRVLFTGTQSQLVIMSIPPGAEIGMETHDDADQILYVVKGSGCAVLGDHEFEIFKGSVICVPEGVAHNIVNDSDEPLQLFTVYAPPEHPAGTVQRTKPVAVGGAA